MDRARLPEDRLVQPAVPGIPGADLQSESPPEAIRVPSGLQATDRALMGDPGRLLSGLGIPDPDQAVPGGAGEPPAVRAPAEAPPCSRPIAGAQAMALSSRPLPVSQTRIVPSCPRVARHFPSGRKVTA